MFLFENIEQMSIKKLVWSLNRHLKRLSVWFSGSFRIQPLKTPYGLPAEQDMADSFINSKGELIVRRLLQPAEPKAIES